MNFTKLFVVFVCIMVGVSYAQIPYVQPPKNIQAIQLFNPQTNDNTPIIELGKGYLLLSFDDLEAGYKRYQYKIEHKNADWSPSNVFQSEYLDGYSSDYIKTYKNSFNTYQKYTNYQIQIPNRDMNIKLSGNYILTVYLDNDTKPIFTKRFAVYQNQVDLGVQATRYVNSLDEWYNQRIQVQVASANVNLTESPEAAKLYVMKNNNWNDGMPMTPQFSRSNQLIYNSNKWVMEGGSEYNWFDTKNLDVPALSTEKTLRQDSVYYTFLRPHEPQYQYLYNDYPDINGNFYIRTIRVGTERNAASEADYTWVNFALEPFDFRGQDFEVFVVGAFNDWQLTDTNKMRMSESGLWEVELYLKQGYYNYQFAVRNTKTAEVSQTYIDGSFWQTENLYQALFYFRPWGFRYDMLIGYGEGNSRK
ncbi:DUF5103 domain-containing protein [Weeksella virosa]|uniref:type IX secretion system plug protein n=1 Tax=Weeksella virosa TaxID=1014 RepID=UPI0025523EB0|nr:type IX secretion system plug protein domain-containing protein [Weeksella virosa]MDK7675730.1 DUF5103 domain-containing protein [Weeksella virosa]